MPDGDDYYFFIWTMIVGNPHLDALALAKNTVDLQLLNDIVLIIDLETQMSIYWSWLISWLI